MNENKWIGGVFLILLSFFLFLYNYKRSVKKGNFGFYEARGFFGALLGLLFGIAITLLSIFRP
ncbi:MAG: hypothetical protein H7331_01215 [Bacteroidia bacterium]|nr:hypothetical protein [Bacteroidia bacterium]